MHGTDLHWLPINPQWSEQLASIAAAETPCQSSWDAYIALSRTRMSALQTLQLDRSRARTIPTIPQSCASTSARIAVLASSTIEHLLPAIRVGGLRRGLWLDTYTPAYGQYAQDLIDPRSNLVTFDPTVVLFAMDAYHLIPEIELSASAQDVTEILQRSLDRLEALWDQARQKFSAQIIQNVPLPVFLPFMGNNEHRLPASRLASLRQFSTMLRTRADVAGIDLITLDDRAAADGLAAWHDPALWHRSKQDIHPQAAPLFGDLVVRLIAAARGRSSKCLVLDLDNTLWGGVIGDDGLAGIKLGNGSARGEAHLAFQRYARDLGRRGVILAVCSKNDYANAVEPFNSHPEMVLKPGDIACFVANWTDKATNLREIAARLNIGVDSLVFADDNPAERAIVRRELPMVEVPELPEDPTGYAACLAGAGFFEATKFTSEDGQRSQLYQQNLARDALMVATTDMDGYLRSLEQKAVWSQFDSVGLPRIVQLINKTNQFNLTTRRVTELEIADLIGSPLALTLQIRLVDKFGDNGIVVVVFGRLEPHENVLTVETWLMSCRVLGRGMEEETLNLIVDEARRLGATSLRGEYRPTPKNKMVSCHYERLGFSSVGTESDGTTWWRLELSGFKRRVTTIQSH